MSEKQLLKEIRKIVYEKQANPDKIQTEIMKFRIGKGILKPTEKEHIVLSACEVLKANPKTTVSLRRNGKAPMARWFIWKFIKRIKPNRSLVQLGSITGGQDHATVLNGLARLNELLTFDKEIIQKYNEFLRLVEEKTI